ncbi:hypothetical protein TUM17386_08900 [Shewanella algae]|nr:hypothetical protein TUM17386_08900 [Shewanella algae]
MYLNLYIVWVEYNPKVGGVYLWKRYGSTTEGFHCCIESLYWNNMFTNLDDGLFSIGSFIRPYGQAPSAGYPGKSEVKRLAAT